MHKSIYVDCSTGSRIELATQEDGSDMVAQLSLYTSSWERGRQILDGTSRIWLTLEDLDQLCEAVQAYRKEHFSGPRSLGGSNAGG